MSSAGVVGFLVAEVGRNALEEPPNFRILSEALATVEEPVIASGGVRDLEDLRKLMLLETSGRNLAGVVVGREVTAGRFTVEEAKQAIAGGGPTRAPGGITTTRTPVGVASLITSLEFYRDILGFNQVRSPSEGVIAAVVEAGPGQHIELVEGGSARPDSLVFHVEDQARWKDHLSNLGVDATAEGVRLILNDPDGLRIVLE
jgi:hypothetical protein